MHFQDNKIKKYKIKQKKKRKLNHFQIYTHKYTQKMSEINALNRKHDLNHNLLKNGNHSSAKTAEITDKLSELTLPKVQCK